LRLVAAVLMGGIILPVHGGQDAPANSRIVCWDDTQGRRVCGDYQTIDGSKRERKIYDPQGRVIDTLPAELTREEREQQAAEARAIAAADRAAREREAHDQLLKLRFASPEEVREDGVLRLKQLDERRELAQQALDDARGAVQALEEREPAPESGDSEEDADIVQRLELYREAVLQRQQNLASLDQQRVDLCRSVDTDIRRYGELTKTSTQGIRLCE